MRYFLWLLPALVVAACSGPRAIDFSRPGPALKLVRADGSHVARASVGMLPGIQPVMLPSGDAIVCGEVTPTQFRIKRLTPRMGSVWSTSFAVPESKRVERDHGDEWIVPADDAVLLTRAGATVGLLCTRRIGPDSLAISTRLFDTATGQMLRDTVLMRQRIDTSLPDFERQIAVALSPGGRRIVIYARARPHRVETTDLAMQILDPYLNPIAQRKLRCRLANVDQNGLLQVSDEGTILLLAKSSGRDAEILRIEPEGSVPERRSILSNGLADSLSLDHFAFTLGGDGRVRVAAIALRGAAWAGVASTTVDFITAQPAQFGFAPFPTDTATRSLLTSALDTDRSSGVALLRGGIRSILPAPDGMTVLYAFEVPMLNVHRQGTDLYIGAMDLDAKGTMLRHHLFAGERFTGYWRSNPIEAWIARDGMLRITYVQDGLIASRVYHARPEKGDGEEQEVAIVSRAGTHIGRIMPGTIAWISERALMFGVEVWDQNGGLPEGRDFIRVDL